jgi:hypothetical protein
LYSLKKGTITVVNNSKKEPTIVFEYCDDVEVMQEAADTYYARFNNDRIKMIYKGDWTVSNYPMLPYQEYSSSTNITTLKIITPANVAVCFEFMRKGYRIYGYVKHFNDDDIPHIATLINQTRVYRERNVYNYLPSGGIFAKFAKLIYTRNVYFESMEIGEYFRDFLKNCIGAETLMNVYK